MSVKLAMVYPAFHDRVHRHHGPAAARAAKTNQTFGVVRRGGCQLREIKGAPMIALFDSVSDALQLARRMIEFSRDLDLQFRMSRHGVIIDR